MKNKKGLILPMVLCFMILSQVIYLGVIQLNAIQRQRILQSNNYFQLQIQSLLSYNALRPIFQEYWIDSLEKSIQKDYQLLQRESLNNYHLFTSDPLSHPLDLIEVVNLELESYRLLYKSLVYISSLSQFKVDFSTIEADGEWSNNNQMIIFPDSSKQSSFEASHLTLISQDFLLRKQLDAHKTAQWVGNLDKEYQIILNTGETIIYNSDDDLICNSRLHSGEPFEKKWSLPKINYLLQWQGNLYQDPEAS